MTENEYKHLRNLVFSQKPYDHKEERAIIKIFEEIQQYRAIGTIEEFKALKEKSNKDFELLLKAVKESYPMFKGAYVEVDVFMGDVMRRFARDRKEA